MGRRQRERIESSYHCYCHTHEEAKTWLVKKAMGKVNSAKTTLEHFQKKLDETLKL